VRHFPPQSPPVEQDSCASFPAVGAAIPKVDRSDGAPVAWQVDFMAPRILAKMMSDIWRKSLSVAEGYDHVIHFQWGAFHGDPKRSERPFASTDLDSLSLNFEFSHALAQEFPAPAAVRSICDRASRQ
jgi:hypothetical protein